MSAPEWLAPTENRAGLQLGGIAVLPGMKLTDFRIE
jgi:hypothetical protein